MFRIAALGLTALAAVSVTAQETYWIANRASNDIMEVSTWGTVLQRVDMGNSLRSAHVAPDGKVWVVRFIQGTFDIYDPATNTITPVASTLGNPYDIAFDAQGTAWVSGGTGVQNFDANGALIMAYPLPAAAPLGITIDAAGNKWIAHRTTSGSVSRIDPAGVVTNHAVSGSNPVRAVADYRGLFAPSHIWVTCDSGGALLELDSTGVELFNHTMPATQIGTPPVYDLNGNIWVGNYSNGDLYQVDPATGSVLATISAGAGGAGGLTVDSLGRLLVSQRVTFAPPGPPCEIERIDPVTGLFEMTTLLELGGNSGFGTQSPPSTPYHYSLVVNAVGDLDGDGDANFAEVTGGFFPNDPCSNSNVSISTSGTTNATTGGTANLDIQVPAGTFWIAGIAQGMVAAGAGIVLPGVTCEVRLDPTMFLGSLAGTGTTSVPVNIPADPGLVGAEFIFQTLAINAVSAIYVSNLTGMRLF